MKKLILLLLAATLPALGQSNSVYNASTYAYTTQVTIGNAATGSTSIGVNPTAFAQGIPFLPYNVNASVTINRNASTAETITPSAIANCYPNSLRCTLSSSFTYKHVAGESIQSGTFGLQEAINVAVADGAGTVLIDASWQGPSGSTLILAAKGNGNVMIQDNRSPSGAAFYQWNGTAYAKTGGGGGASPAGNAVIQGSSADGSTLISTNEVVATQFTTPEAAVAAACAAPSHAVYFPTGSYPVTTGMQACSGLHLRCAGASFLGNSNVGTIFQAQPGFANWMLYNPNAGSGTPIAGVRNITVENCGWDVSEAATTALGVWDIYGITWSQFLGNNFFTNNNAHPVITLDGGNLANNGGDYDNDFVGNKIYNNATGGAQGIGVFLTNSSTTAGDCANENHWFGGTIVRFGTAIKIDCGDNNSFENVDLEDSGQYGIWLTSQTYGSASGNHFISPRLELPGNPAIVGIQIDSGAASNTFITPYMSGSFIYYVDNNSPVANTCINCLLGSPGSNEYGSVYAVGANYENIGVNMIPSMLDGYNFGFISVHGEIQSDRAFVLGNLAGGGGYNSLHSSATSGVTNILPLVAGNILGTNEMIPLTPTCQSTIGSNCQSYPIYFEGEYTTSQVAFVAYVSGITATGTVGQTCTLSGFNNGSSATATVALTGTNTIATDTTATVTSEGTGATAPPTTATAGNGTATCSGTATVVTALASPESVFTVQNNMGTGTNPNSNLTWNYSGPGTGTYYFENANQAYFNTTAATSSANVPAPSNSWIGAIWNGTANALDTWTLTPTLGTGANPTSSMVWAHSGSTGAAYHQFPGISLAGSTPVTSTSSSNTQMVTCPTGGSGTQVCDAAGAWISPGTTPLTGTTTSLGGSSLAAGACSSTTLAVTSLTTTMGVVVTPQTYPGDGFYWEGYASAAGTATVKVCAAAAGTPTASLYNVRVIQ